MSKIVDEFSDATGIEVKWHQVRSLIEFVQECGAAARREGIEAAIGAASRRAASRHSTVAHCRSDRSKKHMQIRADEAGQLVADIRALLEDGHLATAREVMRRRAGALRDMEDGR